jgi:potassium-transporting ATPase KdpC subunit
MSLLRDALRALRLTAALWLISVVLYTLPLLMIGQGLFPAQANGSLLRLEGRVVGSALIGQPFASARYFWGRPSAIAYSTGPGAPSSSPSNLGPTNPALATRVREGAELLHAAGLRPPAADLLYASGSGLDPHLSPGAAAQQIERVSAARRLSPDQLRQLVRRHTKGRSLGLLGEPRVNVLMLNLELDRLAP